MAGSKQKRVKQRENPGERKIVQRENPGGRAVAQKENPDSIYSQFPSWRFCNSDACCWTFSKDLLWEEILPFLKNNENRTWGDILINAKKQNHSIDISALNKGAKQRLEELYIEAESIVSLRLNGTHRIYGYLSANAFNILWYDDNHGDNDTCVCRSNKKHT